LDQLFEAVMPKQGLFPALASPHKSASLIPMQVLMHSLGALMFDEECCDMLAKSINNDWKVRFDQTICGHDIGEFHKGTYIGTDTDTSDNGITYEAKFHKVRLFLVSMPFV
jgi:hypothetical protein